MNRVNKLSFLAVVIVLALIGFYSFAYIGHRGKTKVVIVALPHDSSLTLDGVKLAEGSLYLKPGSHTLTAERQYFDKFSRKVDTQNLKAGQTIYLMPLPVSKEALTWLKDHPGVQAEREAAGGAEDQEIQSTLGANYPIIKSLPYTDIRGPFTINYGTIPNGTYELTVTDSSPNGRLKALKWIRDQGDDPSNYQIIFQDTSNPFIPTPVEGQE